MRQAGVEGVVSALHHLPTGSVWTPAEITERQRVIGLMSDGAPSGLAWEVVESMTNLARAGIEVICYNFMPVLDWTRTDLAFRLSSGATCMRFDLVDFAAFDIHILARPGAAEGFPAFVVEEAARRFAEMDDNRRIQLAGNVVFRLPGAAEPFTLEDVRAHLAVYDTISEDSLRSHLIDFLAEVAPLAEELGVRLCCHPDDPPFPLLGLPRIMSTEVDYSRVMNAVDLPANGITLCTGSLGARHDNDLPGMMKRLGSRVHFLHLRNVFLETPHFGGSFHEAGHLEGGTDMVAMIGAILAEERARKAAGRADWEIPMRPDHGQDILDDLKRKAQPGYPAIGRPKGLAELRGIMTALDHPLARGTAT